MAHVTIPMSTSAPVSGLSLEDRSKLVSPSHTKYGSLKYADVNKVEVLDVNENFAEPKEQKDHYKAYSPTAGIAAELRSRYLNDTGPDAELDTSQFTATTDHSSLADTSDNSEVSFEKNSPVARLNSSSPGGTPINTKYPVSPDKSPLFSIEEFGESNQPGNDITSDWDVTSHQTPLATPVKIKHTEKTPESASTAHTPSSNSRAHTPGSGSKNRSFSELARVVSDAVRNILDSSSIQSGEVSPRPTVPPSSPVDINADTTADITVDREDQLAFPLNLNRQESITSVTSDLNVSRTLSRQGTQEESELEKATVVDAATEQDLIYSVVNDEETASSLISDALLAESIVASSSVPSSITNTVSAPSPIVTVGSFGVREEIIEETSFELRVEQLRAEQSEKELGVSPDQQLQFHDSMAEVEVDDETKATAAEKKLDSDDAFVLVSGSEIKPEQNSEMDTASDSKDATNADGSKLLRTMSENGVEENKPLNGTAGMSKTKSDSEITMQITDGQQEDGEQPVNGQQEGETKGNNQGSSGGTDGGSGEEKDEGDGKDNGKDGGQGNKEHLSNGDVAGVNGGQHPDDGSNNGQQSDLESTQDMTDVEEDLRKASEETAKRQYLNALRKRSSQSRTDGFSENSIEDLRQAVMTREAVIAKADRGMRHSPSDAVLQYQERKSKFDIRQDMLKVIPNGTLIGALEPRPTLPVHQTRPLIGFKPGRAILIEGIVQKPAQSFSISLQTAEQSHASDVAMLISPSFTDKSILCNTYCHDTWGAPQIFDRKFPFVKTEKFEIKIATDTHCFKIYVNGQRLLDYDHRMPVDRVRFLRLEGDCVFNNVECPYVLDLPYVLDVDHGFRDSSGVMLDAFVWPQANMFELNLLCGEKARQTHASFMMKVIYLEDDLVKVEMASFCNDRVGEQHMVEGLLDIQRGQDFKLRIICMEKSFSIEVDGVELADYDHHLPIEKLGHVLIDGDISLYAVKFMRPNRRVSSGLVMSNVYEDETCCQCAIT